MNSCFLCGVVYNYLRGLVPRETLEANMKMTPDESLLWCMCFANMCGMLMHPGSKIAPGEGSFEQVARYADQAIMQLVARSEERRHGRSG